MAENDNLTDEEEEQLRALLKKANPNPEDELGDCIIIITQRKINDDDRSHDYPITHVYRYDFEEPKSNREDFIKHVEKHKAIIEGGQMKNKCTGDRGY